PWIPDHLAAAIQRALEREPAKRFASAAEMRTALMLSCKAGEAPLKHVELVPPIPEPLYDQPTQPFQASSALKSSVVPTSPTPVSQKRTGQAPPRKWRLLALIAAATALLAAGAGLWALIRPRVPQPPNASPTVAISPVTPAPPAPLVPAAIQMPS